MVDKQSGSEKVQIKIPDEVAKIMSKWGGHNMRLAAARGSLPMSGPNLVTVLFIFVHGENAELKKEALNTLRTLPASIMVSALANRQLHFSIVDLLVRTRYRDAEVMVAAMAHPEISLRSYEFLAKYASGDVLDMLSHNDQLLLRAPAIRAAIIDNPNADKVMKLRLGWLEPVEEPEPEPEPVQQTTEQPAESDQGDEQQNEDQEQAEFEDEEGLSKYQMLQEMSVAEKIKMALTGDKEWRSLLIRESNKMVNTAVLKNPRITDGEIITIAKNRTSSDEMIRAIMLNKDWVKHYEVKKALVEHPRTPLQKAMRFMTFLTERDIKELSKSRNVSQAIVNNARRMLISKKH